MIVKCNHFHQLLEDCYWRMLKLDFDQISIGKLLRMKYYIGDDVVIGANSYVNKAFESNQVAYGNPCKFVRDRKKGDSYLT